MRASDPDAVASALAKRERGMLSFPRKLFLVAADHPGRGVLAAGGDPRAMADRGAFLDRLTIALAHPEVDGVLATADIVDDLALLGALNEKVVFGSMNRGGLAGSVFELDDRFTGYTAAAIARDGLNGGKMMLRVADDDPGTVRTMEACAAAIDALGALGLHAMIEVFASRTVDGTSSNDLSVEATMRAIAVASALGGSSARTWLKLPVMDEQERLLSATTLPVVLLGGDPGRDEQGRVATYARWAASMTLPQVRGLVAGRTLLYPPDGDVRGAVDAAAKIVRG
ncbi:MAG TPA: aldolase [Patescibacteria group bacterium]|nr:aldolase [Patescibacteria group bacterium]